MGKFDTHGGYFAPKDYMRIGAGGTHEENPNGGVQIGVAPDGAPNLLEEGEPVYQDYVYSDNIRADKKFLEENTLPAKYAGKLYSEIADDIFSESEERPLDPISRNGLNTLLGRLANAQEGQKQAKQQKELESELSQLSPEELAELEAMLTQEEAPVEEAMPMPEQTEVPVAPMMACGGKLHKYPEGGEIHLYETLPENYVIDKAKKMPQFSPFAVWQNPTAITLAGERPRFSAPVVPLDFGDEVRTDETPLANLGYDLYGQVTAPNLSSYTETVTENDIPETTPVPIATTASYAPLLPTWSRYAKAIGSGILGLYDAFQKPDRYTTRPMVPHTAYGKMNVQNEVYNPIDQNMIANAQIAQANRTARALQGTGPSTAANLLALDNNTTANLGTGFIQGVQANNQQRNAVIAANNAAEARRAKLDYALSQYNAAAKDAADRQNIQNELLLQRLNNMAESEKYAALSNQINTGLDALSSIGRENFYMNQVNTNPALLDYITDKGGGIRWGKACGGTLLKKYKK